MIGDENGSDDSARLLNRTAAKDPTFSSEPQARVLFAENKLQRRKRMNPEDRRRQIVVAAAKVVAVKGFWGMSLQDVADEIGITEAALYHYIDTKDDLLGMIVEDYYDSTAASEYTYGNARGEDCDGHEFFYFPRFCLNDVTYNIKRPELVKMFSILNAEALSPEHPAHGYFIKRHEIQWQQIAAMNWVLPRRYRDDINRFHHLWLLAMSAMDGLQLRWLADSSADLLEEWLAFSDELFPKDLWTGFSDPSEYDSTAGCLRKYGLLSSREGSAEDGQAEPHPAEGCSPTGHSRQGRLADGQSPTEH